MDILSQLTASNIITAEVAAAVQTALDGGADIETTLLENGVSEKVVRDQMALFYEIPAFNPDEGSTAAANVLEYLPAESAQHYKIVPVKIEDDVLLIAVNDPEKIEIRQVLNFVSSKHGLPYRFVFALRQDIEKLLENYENLTGEVDEALNSLESELDEDIAQKRSGDEAAAALQKEHIKEDAPVTKIVATILRYAVDGEASDIHIEPTGSSIKVRFRVDGLLAESLKLPRNVQSAVVARIKILSSMRLDERRRPQDGRFSATFDGNKIDFRVSILPTSHGEKVVMRILDNKKGVTSLENTGASEHNLAIIRRMIKQPFGIILISGPTGSGKSTTLYSMLAEIDRSTKNVLSLEDPVEYNIDDVSQSQVRPEIGYTFANGLRSALRQDPDVIMVGEIRDKETAQLAIQASLTGHLVLSTIHTNNAIGVIPRLIDMGIDPYLIAPTLKATIAQRLARRICPGTGKKVPVDAGMKNRLDEEFKDLDKKYHDRIPEMETVLHPEPSPGCISGTKGRIAVMETLEITEDIQELILKNASEEDVYHTARKAGFMSMKEDVIIKALKGQVPYEEVSVFGTKAGEENATDSSFLPVDNPQAPEVGESPEVLEVPEIDEKGMTIEPSDPNVS